MGIFFISDSHFNHANVITYSKRPYKNVQEMTEKMIVSWNQTVNPDDTVYHLGDFAMGAKSEIPNVIKRLNGRIHLIFGNHDDAIRNTPSWCELFASTQDYLEVKVPDKTIGHQHVVLSHYAYRVWNRSHRGSWNLHGHSHGNLPELDGYLQMDVGVDATRLYRPASYAEIKIRMSHKTFKPVDHHGAE